MRLRMIWNDCRSSPRILHRKKQRIKTRVGTAVALNDVHGLTTDCAVCWTLGFGVLSSVDGHRTLQIPTRSGGHTTHGLL